MSIERLLKNPIEIHETKKILFFAENGVDDLINSWTKKFQVLEIDENECSTDYLIAILIKNPLMIKLPVIIDEKKIVIGFNEREIRWFLSKEYRRKQLLDNGSYCLEE
ncbi:ArsC/Spx/MgsR family protein [Enterococcus sp. DIV0421]|uniref:ArsC/Spx/MgsR family protein n=1 Tax=Enterococcus sp. DIV0421 TaxID=2774688 RepID=UPI003F68476C